VWCRMAWFGVIGPYYFREGGRSVTVNSQLYVTMYAWVLTAWI
jgi:hypothetical protein